MSLTFVDDHNSYRQLEVYINNNRNTKFITQVR